MSRLMIKGNQASGIYGNASQVKINEIEGLTAANAQEALVALNNSLSNLKRSGQITFDATTTEQTTTVIFSSPMPNTNYSISLSPYWRANFNNCLYGINNKTTDGFVLKYACLSGTSSMIIEYVVIAN